ncbi:amino acid ABC transporter permease [Desulfobaculum bizertense]|uniref:Putative glutamine transport system permease protein GlnP n=1 Tax=Desulfobaculum bizertense DSM 18034 TaxID=1121442 RepID=A0A1T4WV22_9BACT|nr:amino acid ABC transporter permease [Desulfobaculum bizertense]UIJ38629.1 ABC transporter permease subunit [Desulfobaculum bizertense]SKA81166.1 amino acid ABC transporter membrane protein, PAAT family [Desulfobaculum bizertense DSM 18034]
MSLYPGLDRPRSPLYRKFWGVMFFVLIGLACLGAYGATKYVDYTWRWYRVPQYFYYQEEVKVRSELDGEVSTVEQTEKGYNVTVAAMDGAEETYTIPSKNLLVEEGDFVYPGDVLGSSTHGRLGLFLVGLITTLKVSFIAIILGMIAGMATGLMRISDNPMLKWLAITYIELVRGSPLMVQLMIWYYVIGTLLNQLMANWGLPNIPNLWFGAFGLATFTGAYTAEIVRAGIQSVHRGQMEAARSLGMNYSQAMRKVVMPQAIRRILPALAGQFISLVKDSSLLGVIAVRELTKVTREVVTASLQVYEMWIVCALLYLVLTFILSVAVQYMERKAV